MQVPPPDRIWYLPHHSDENPNKPGKVRRVANAASKFRGQSLNTNLLTGPDLLNSLLGVLMRFRENPIAVLADIEGMFTQIAINQTDLRFALQNGENYPEAVRAVKNHLTWMITSSPMIRKRMPQRQFNKPFRVFRRVDSAS